MSGRHSLSELKAKMSPERLANVEAESQNLYNEYVLGEISRRTDVDMPVSMLSKIVTGLGGVLTFRVDINGSDYPLKLRGRSLAYV